MTVNWTGSYLKLFLAVQGKLVMFWDSDPKWHLLVLVSCPSLRFSIPHMIDTCTCFQSQPASLCSTLWLILTCTCFQSQPAFLHSTYDWYLLVLVSGRSLRLSVPHVIGTYLYLFPVPACISPFHIWLILTCTCFWSEPASLRSTYDWYLLVLVSGPSLRPSVPHMIDTYLYLFPVPAYVPLFYMRLILTCTCFQSQPASLRSTYDWYLLVLVSGPSLRPSVPHVIDTYLYLFPVPACVPLFHMWLILTCTCFRSEPASLRSTCDQTPRRRRTCRVWRPLPGTTTQSCPPAAKQPFKINCITQIQMEWMQNTKILVI